MNNQFFTMNGEEDVIALKEASPSNIIMSHPMFKVQELSDKCTCKLLDISSLDQLQKDSHCKPRVKWIDEGLECEVLNLGASHWKKGKIRVKITIEFCPDEAEIKEPESCLDDIRREIQQNQ